MKVMSKAIADLKKDNNRSAAKKRAMDGELAEIWPLRQHVNELGQLQKKLEERDSKLYQVHEELKKKDSLLELVLEKLRKSDSTIQFALNDNKVLLQK